MPSAKNYPKRSKEYWASYRNKNKQRYVAPAQYQKRGGFKVQSFKIPRKFEKPIIFGPKTEFETKEARKISSKFRAYQLKTLKPILSSIGLPDSLFQTIASFVGLSLKNKN